MYKKALILLSFLCIGSLAAMEPATEEEWNKKIHEITNAPQVTHEKMRQSLIADNHVLLFRLGHRFDHDDLVQAAKPSPAQKIATKDSSTVISLPAGCTHIALSPEGSKVAIAYANKLKVLQKKQGWADDVYENEFRLPLQAIAFANSTQAICAHNKTFHTLALKTKELTGASRDTSALLSTLSHNGKWRFVEERDGDKIVCLLMNLETGFKLSLLDLSSGITHVTKFAADEAGENFIFASPSQFTRAKLTVTGDSWNLDQIHFDVKSKHIADVDITSDGAHTAAVGDTSLFYDTTVFDLPFSANAVRFIPHHAALVLGGDMGIALLDLNLKTNNYLRLFIPHNETIECLAVSADGNSIAAGSENAVYLMKNKEVEQSLTTAEHLLIKRLQQEPAEKVLASPSFADVFKTMKNTNVMQKLIKKFSIDYKKLGYEECPVCKDNVANAQIVCKHNFCSDCIERLQEEKQACPLCRNSQLTVID